MSRHYDLSNTRRVSHAAFCFLGVSMRTKQALEAIVYGVGLFLLAAAILLIVPVCLLLSPLYLLVAVAMDIRDTRRQRRLRTV